MYSLTLNLQMMFMKMSYSVKVDIIHCINGFFLKIFRGKNDENTHREQYHRQYNQSSQ